MMLPYLLEMEVSNLMIVLFRSSTNGTTAHLNSLGIGESQPIESNQTEAGRACKKTCRFRASVE